MSCELHHMHECATCHKRHHECAYGACAETAQFQVNYRYETPNGAVLTGTERMCWDHAGRQVRERLAAVSTELLR